MVLYLSGEFSLTITRRDNPKDGLRPKHHLVDVREVERQTKPAINKAPHVYSWPKCERNHSAAMTRNFSSLPSHIQDFLYYRHCRHFPLLLDIPDKCGGVYGSAKVFLLLVIKSSPVNYERREVIRKTWGAERLSSGVWIRRVFISATMDTGYEEERLNHLLRMEHHKYNDILQWDFHDTFYNLTLKQMLFLEWMEKNCPNANFLFNGDDDIFANPDKMVNYLKSLKENSGDKHLYTGAVNWYGPVREEKSKYYIPFQLQKSELFQPYCSGGGFLLSGFTASVVFRETQTTPLFPIDDAYFGMCLAKVGLGPSSLLGVYTEIEMVPGVKEAEDDLNPCFYRDIFIVHRFHPAHLFYMWHRLQEPDLNCTLADVQTQLSAIQSNISNPNPTQSSATNVAKPQVQD